MSAKFDLIPLRNSNSTNCRIRNCFDLERQSPDAHSAVFSLSPFCGCLVVSSTLNFTGFRVNCLKVKCPMAQKRRRMRKDEKSPLEKRLVEEILRAFLKLQELGKQDQNLRWKRVSLLVPK